MKIKNRHAVVKLCGLLLLMLLPGVVMATALGAGGGAGGTEFQALYTWVFAAATGYLGRSIAIIGGIIGLGLGAGMGKALPAVIGVFLALFGVLGPVIIDAIFTSALI